jgi:hypothetical protein
MSMLLPPVLCALMMLWREVRHGCELWNSRANSHVFVASTSVAGKDAAFAGICTLFNRWLERHLGLPSGQTAHVMRYVVISDASVRYGADRAKLERLGLVMRHSSATATRYYDVSGDYAQARQAQVDLMTARGQIGAMPLLPNAPPSSGPIPPALSHLLMSPFLPDALPEIPSVPESLVGCMMQITRLKQIMRGGSTGGGGGNSGGALAVAPLNVMLAVDRRVAEQNDEANGTGDANDDNYDKSLLDAANADDMSGFAAPTGPAEEIFHVTELINSANDVGDGHPEENDNDEMEFEESQGEEDEEGGDADEEDRLAAWNAFAAHCSEEHPDRRHNSGGGYGGFGEGHGGSVVGGGHGGGLGDGGAGGRGPGQSSHIHLHARWSAETRHTARPLVDGTPGRGLGVLDNQAKRSRLDMGPASQTHVGSDGLDFAPSSGHPHESMQSLSAVTAMAFPPQATLMPALASSLQPSYLAAPAPLSSPQWHGSRPAGGAPSGPRLAPKAPQSRPRSVDLTGDT